MEMMERMKLVRGGKSQDTFAHDVGVSKMTVGRWERGERTPDADDLNRILKAHPDINPAWLLTGEGEMRWSEEGKALVDSQKATYSQFSLNEAGLDTDLIKYVLAAVEFIADDIGRDANIFSVSDRIMITIKLYNTHIDNKLRPHVTLDRMIEQAMNTYFFNVPLDKIERLRNRIKTDPSNPLLNIVDTFIELRHDAAKIDREVAMKQAEREKSRKDSDEG